MTSKYYVFLVVLAVVLAGIYVPVPAKASISPYYPPFKYISPYYAGYPQAAHYSFYDGHFLAVPYWDSSSNTTTIRVVDTASGRVYAVTVPGYAGALAVIYNATAGGYELILSGTPPKGSSLPETYYQGVLISTGRVLWTIDAGGFIVGVYYRGNGYLVVGGLVIDTVTDSVEGIYYPDYVYMYPVADGYHFYQIVPVGSGYYAVGYFYGYVTGISRGYTTHVVVSYIAPYGPYYLSIHTEFYSVPSDTYMNIGFYPVNSTYYQLYTPSYLAIYNDGTTYYYPSGYSNTTCITAVELAPGNITVNGFSADNITGSFFTASQTPSNKISIYWWSGLGVLANMSLVPRISTPMYTSTDTISYDVSEYSPSFYTASSGYSSSRIMYTTYLGDLNISANYTGYWYSGAAAVNVKGITLPPAYPVLEINTTVTTTTTPSSLSVSPVPVEVTATLVHGSYPGFAVNPNTTYISPARYMFLVTALGRAYLLPFEITIWPYSLVTPPYTPELGGYRPSAVFVLRPTLYPVYTDYPLQLYWLRQPVFTTTAFTATYTPGPPGTYLINVAAKTPGPADVFGNVLPGNMYWNGTCFTATIVFNTSDVLDMYKKIPYAVGLPFTEFYPSTDNRIYPYVSGYVFRVYGATEPVLSATPIVSFLDTVTGNVLLTIEPSLPFLGYNQTLYVTVVHGLKNYYAVLLALNYTYQLLYNEPVYTAVAYNLTSGTILSEGAFRSLYYLGGIFPGGAITYPGGGIELLVRPLLAPLYTTSISYYTLGIGRATDAYGNTVEWVRLITDYPYIGAVPINDTASLLVTYGDGLLNVSIVEPEIVPSLFYEVFDWSVTPLHSYNITNPMLGSNEKELYPYNSTAVAMVVRGLGYYVVTEKGMEKMLAPDTQIYLPWSTGTAIYPATSLYGVLDAEELVKAYSLYTPSYLGTAGLYGELAPIAKAIHAEAFIHYSGSCTYILVAGRLYTIPGQLSPGKYVLSPTGILLSYYPEVPPPTRVTDLYMPSTEISAGSQYTLQDVLTTNYIYPSARYYSVLAGPGTLTYPVSPVKAVYTAAGYASLSGQTVNVTLSPGYILANYTYSFVAVSSRLAGVPVNGTDYRLLYSIYYNVISVYPCIIIGNISGMYYPLATAYMVGVQTPYGLLVSLSPTVYMNWTSVQGGIRVYVLPVSSLPVSMLLYNSTPVAVYVDGVQVPVELRGAAIAFDPIYDLVIRPVAVTVQAQPPPQVSGAPLPGNNYMGGEAGRDMVAWQLAVSLSIALVAVMLAPVLARRRKK